MSAFRGKADMTLCGSPLSPSLLGVERTSPGALHMSAYDPKRTLDPFVTRPLPPCYIAPIRCLVLPLGGEHEAAQIHHAYRRCGGGGRVAARCACAAAGDAGNWVSQRRFCQGLYVTIVSLPQRAERSRLRRWPERDDRIPLGGEPN